MKAIRLTGLLLDEQKRLLAHRRVLIHDREALLRSMEETLFKAHHAVQQFTESPQGTNLQGPQNTTPYTNGTLRQPIPLDRGLTR
jgi:hypothetical protein